MDKLIELGAVKTTLAEYVASRNKYTHEVMLAVRYEPDDDGVILFDYTPIDHGISTTLITVTADELKGKATQLTNERVGYLDGTRVSELIARVFQYAREIPPVPPDKLQRFKVDPKYRDTWVREWNVRLFGKQWRKLIPEIRRRMGIP